MFTNSGLRVCHLGDPGYLTDEQIKEIGRTDVLLARGRHLHHRL